ncbi:MAG: PD-(D/E)XK nuclease domain-containing protein, partial [Endomicrobium sp.]|nr:PD-(D/E)XK nuclease domain-containing protein [Endomicrobium sp.]
AHQVESRVLIGADDKKVNIKTLLFQTGYLTVKKEEIVDDKSRYTIDFPNYEVRSAFLEDLIGVYANKDLEEVQEINKEIGKALKEGEAKKLQESLVELYANIPYDLHIGKEKYYHSLFLVTMTLIGYEVEGEVHTDKGRIDVVLKKENSIVIVETKYSKDNKLEEMLKEAMEQIRENKYYEKYISSNPTLLAIAFSENKDIGCRFENT